MFMLYMFVLLRKTVGFESTHKGVMSGCIV